MKKFFQVFLGFVFLILLAEIGYLFFKQGSLAFLPFSFLKQKESALVNKQNESALVALPGYKYSIIHQKEDDTAGRTIAYSSVNSSFLNGSGVIQYQDKHPRIIIGKVAAITPVEQSEDEYITLADITSDRELLKGRINYNSLGDPTDIRVENLSSLNQGSILVEGLGSAESLGKEVLHNILKNEDVVVVLTRFEDEDISRPLLDESQNPYLIRIILRRFEGKEAIKKEANI